MKDEDIVVLRETANQIRYQLKQGALSNGLVVVYANESDAAALERILQEIEQGKQKEAKITPQECRDAIDLFNRLCPSLPTVKSMTEGRKNALRLAKEKLGAEGFEVLFRKTEASDFLSGRSSKWRASFDWILKKSNLVRIMEGNYDNSAPAEQKGSFDVNEFYAAALRRTYESMKQP